LEFFVIVQAAPEASIIGQTTLESFVVFEAVLESSVIVHELQVCSSSH
jgi:hypothetical protein